MQRIAGLVDGGGLEVEPPLPSFGRGSRIPGDIERLIAPIGKPDQVLLQRFDAERVRDLELGPLPGSTGGVDEKRFTAAEKTSSAAEVFERRVVEVAEYTFRGRGLHGAIVVGALPAPALLAVAIGAGQATDERRDRGLGRAARERRVGP